MFPRVSTRLSAVLCLVARVSPLLVARSALLLCFPTFLHAYRPSFGLLCTFFLFWWLNQRSFSVSPRFYMLIDRPLAGCARFTSFGRSVSAPLAFPRISTRLSADLWLVVRLFPLMVPRTALLQHFPAFLLAYRASFGWLRAFYLFWSLGQRSFSVSPRFYHLIGRRLAGCAPFSTYGRSVSAPLAFPGVSTRLSAVLWLVVRLFPLMVPRTALLQHFPAFLLSYRASFGWLRAFYLFWSLCRRSFSVSPRFYPLIGRRLAGCAPFSTYGRSVSAPLAFPRVSTRLSAVLWLVVRVSPLLVARSALL